jgi:hypothetical protein
LIFQIIIALGWSELLCAYAAIWVFLSIPLLQVKIQGKGSVMKSYNKLSSSRTNSPMVAVSPSARPAQNKTSLNLHSPHHQSHEPWVDESFRGLAAGFQLLVYDDYTQQTPHFVAVKVVFVCRSAQRTQRLSLE